MAFDHRDLDFSDRHEKALSDRLGTADAVVLACAVSVHSSMDERSYLLVIPRIDGPEVVGATVHWPSDDRPYVRINEIGSVATVTRRRVPTEMLRPLEMDRNLDTAFAFAALGSHGAQLWYNGTGRDSVCLVRSLDTASDDPVLLTFVAAWGDDEFQDEWSDEWKTEVLGRSSASEFRDWAASTFETTIKND